MRRDSFNDECQDALKKWNVYKAAKDSVTRDVEVRGKGKKVLEDIETCFNVCFMSVTIP